MRVSLVPGTLQSAHALGGQHRPAFLEHELPQLFAADANLRRAHPIVGGAVEVVAVVVEAVRRGGKAASAASIFGCMAA
jgi:hypothetical protein